MEYETSELSGSSTEEVSLGSADTPNWGLANFLG